MSKRIDCAMIGKDMDTNMGGLVMEKVAIIFTGGTIGSKQEGNWISPNRQQGTRLIQEYIGRWPEKGRDIELVEYRPYEILSENLEASYVELLIATVEKCIAERTYKGIIICHGTDTLQYTAAILDLVFPQVDIPLVLISANYPLEHSKSNGLANFYYGMECIRQGMKSVLVVYKNADDYVYVHRGNRLLSHQTYRDDLYSASGGVIGWYNSVGEFCRSSNDFIQDKDQSHSFAFYEQSRCLPPDLIAELKTYGLRDLQGEVLWWTVRPGSVGPRITERTRYLILEAYHSGTICVNESVKRYITQAKQQQVRVLLVGLSKADEGYETIKEYGKMGIEVITELTPIALYCKLWLEIGAKHVEK